MTNLNERHEAFPKAFPKTALLLDASRGDVFPAFAVGVRLKERSWLWHGGCGQESLFDLASLTKVLCTATLAALAECRGLFSTNATVASVFPSFPDTRVRLSHLLEHSSGLPWWLPLHSAFHDEHGLGSFDPVTTPGTARSHYETEILKSHDPAQFERGAVYSDLGFMLLGWALEKTAASPLDRLFQRWVADATDLASLRFLPISPDIVPTEDCPWRGRVLRGEVHDDNCFVLGGVAGHAGLFGNVADTLKLGGLWLDAFLGKGCGWLPAEAARKFWAPSHVAGSTRALGWDGVSREGSSTGHFFNASSRGHLGFTGTSLWIDPERELVVTLLTNRVHPTRANEKIKTFRPIFHDTLLTELGFG